MIEILFGTSACASLKLAQHYGQGEFLGSSIGFFAANHPDGSKPTKEEIKAARQEAEEKARLVWEKATPMVGDPADVYGFPLLLSIGDISENQPGSKRQQALEHLFSVYPAEICRAAREIVEKAQEDLTAVRQRTALGESLRIWYSDQPDEMCGFYWFMEQLNQWAASDQQISIVKLPEWGLTEEGSAVLRESWNGLAPQEWRRYLDLGLQKPMPPYLKQHYAALWRELQRENGPLRAVLNGQLVSASEKLYDDFILLEIAAAGQEFQEARVIGQVLGKYQGISNAWAARRIEEMIRAGKLEVITEAAGDSPIYHRVLKKCPQEL